MLQKKETNKLISKSIRVTDFRKKVLTIFENHNRAISVSDIEDNLTNYDRVTLYRTLKTFTEKGLIHEIILPNEDKKLALCENSCSNKGHYHKHVHFKCTNCKNVFCKEVKQIPPIKIKGFKVQKTEINLSGLCNNCS